METSKLKYVKFDKLIDAILFTSDIYDYICTKDDVVLLFVDRAASPTIDSIYRFINYLDILLPEISTSYLKILTSQEPGEYFIDKVIGNLDGSNELVKIVNR